MSLSELKKRELFEYYSKNGFDQTTGKIVDGLDICHKTFFNRYGTKAKSIEIAWQYWQKICRDRWDALMQHCNHSVEAMVVTLYHIRAMSREEPHYYRITRDQRLYLQRDSFFYSVMRSVLDQGKRCFHVQDNLNVETYIQFVLNNLFLIDVAEDKRPDVLR